VARNKSERLPRILLSKKATPGTWASACPVQLIELPEEVYLVRLLDGNRIFDGAETWRQVSTSQYSDALEVYDKMVDGFYFREITRRKWQYGPKQK